MPALAELNRSDQSNPVAFTMDGGDIDFIESKNTTTLKVISGFSMEMSLQAQDINIKSPYSTRLST